ncbi:MAG: endonuclease III [Lentisphaeria bacterium]|nr:endonuclease III [Lentisphaeria bacterium]
MTAADTGKGQGTGRPGALLGREACEGFFEALSKHITPRSELRWTTPLDLLLAVVLSAQSTDRSVNRITADLWRRCREPEDYLALGEDGLVEAIRSIGLFRNKARAILGICRALRERFGNRVPDTREELESLPGVGRKSANVVLNVAFRQPVMAVDTHVFRVANRTGLARGKTPLEVERQLMQRVPARFLTDAHHYLILHGRYTCTARRPRCAACPVADLCLFDDKTPAPTAET